jgi:hypothetical protein
MVKNEQLAVGAIRLGEVAREALLACGVLASLLYVAANVIVPMQYAGYSVTDLTVSELSAIGAPTRELWLMLMAPYGALLIAFGCGVWMSAIADRGLRIADFEAPSFERRHARPDGRRLRMVGATLILQGVTGFFWPPMHMRGAETSLTDMLHIAFTLIVVPLMIFQIWFSRALLGSAYAIVTLVVVLGFGLLTGLDGPNIAANLPTPWIGVWERISIGAWVAWTFVLVWKLWRFR